MEGVLTSLIPRLVKENVFGDVEFVSVGADDDTKIGAQFSSAIAALNLTLREKSGDLSVIHLFVKVQDTSSSMKDFKDSNTMFYNEVQMYKEILPQLDAKDKRKYARMYHGYATGGEDPESDVLILENLKVYGFESSTETIFLDSEHISTAMRAIGQLHAMSYSMKHTDPHKFRQLVDKLKIRDEFKSYFEPISFHCIKRGVDAASENNPEKDVLDRFLKVIKPLFDIIKLLNIPDERFGVVLHGDFCNNNLLYKYDSNKKPVDCAYFDFQFSKYGCPVVDLATFLYMHTTAQNRESHWSDYLETYWKSVEDNVHQDVELPSFEEFLKYFSSKAVLGYFVSSSFLPFMVYRDTVDLEKVSAMTIEESVIFHLELGGDGATKLVKDIVTHLLVNKYIHSFLEKYEERDSS